MGNRTLLIATVVILLALVGFAIYISSQSEVVNEPPNYPKEIKFEELKKGFKNSITQKQEKIIKSEKEWSDLWTEMFPKQMISPPKIFDKKMLIAVFLGEKATGGYAIEITKIEENEKSIDVFVKETSPGETCIVTLALTSPFYIVELEKTDKTIQFIFEEEVKNC